MYFWAVYNGVASTPSPIDHSICRCNMKPAAIPVAPQIAAAVVSAAVPVDGGRGWTSFGLLLFELNLIVWAGYYSDRNAGNAIKELEVCSILMYLDAAAGNLRWMCGAGYCCCQPALSALYGARDAARG